MVRSDLFHRLEEYARRRSLRLGERLGSGVHGIVSAAESQRLCGWSAVKAHEAEPAYIRERDVYQRLQESAVSCILGCNVPMLIDFDNDLAVIEMTIVTRPFVLDFAGAYLNGPPEFPEDVLAEWHTEKVEQFGPRWPEVEAVLRELERLDIHMVDVNPGNISFAE